MTTQLITTKKFTDWMNEGFAGKSGEGWCYQICEQLVLADGTELSIQAGRSHYCEPRTDSPNGDYDYYDSFEIGFPSKEIEEILEYAEEPESPTGTVYGYVPKTVIENFINARGGVVAIKGDL
jgi:hypothetical protein